MFAYTAFQTFQEIGPSDISHMRIKKKGDSFFNDYSPRPQIVKVWTEETDLDSEKYSFNKAPITFRLPHKDTTIDVIFSDEPLSTVPAQYSEEDLKKIAAWLYFYVGINTIEIPTIKVTLKLQKLSCSCLSFDTLSKREDQNSKVIWDFGKQTHTSVILSDIRLLSPPSE